MNGADDVAVFFRGLAERAVMQENPPFASDGDGLGGEADVVQRTHQLLSRSDRVDAPERRGSFGEVTAPDLPGLQASRGGLRDLRSNVAGEDVREQPVATLSGARSRAVVKCAVAR